MFSIVSEEWVQQNTLEAPVTIDKLLNRLIVQEKHCTPLADSCLKSWICVIREGLSSFIKKYLLEQCDVRGLGPTTRCAEQKGLALNSKDTLPSTAAERKHLQ